MSSKLGEILLQEGLITKDQLEQAISAQRQEKNARIGEIFIKLGIVKEQDVIAALGKQLSIPYVSLGAGLLKPIIDQGLEELVPKDFALKNLVLPLSKSFSSLTCAVYDPLDLILIDNLRKMTGCEINPVIATKSDILQAIEDFYGKLNLLKEAVKDSYKSQDEETVEAQELRTPEEEELSIDKLIARAEEAPVIKLVDLIIRQAIDERASDIHIEPFKNRISLRYRIDGVLYEIPPPARHLHLPIVSRIKILSKLDIAEKRLPQDGSFIVKLENKTIDLRISIVPTIYGEKAVLRLLDRTQIPLDLAQLGFDSNQLKDFRRSIRSPYGMVFLTGPTGSGKTTTLYAALSEVKDPRKNIITVEDPVEYHLEGVNQVQIKPDIGLTFASSLRAFLRQDPDIMMVGEVRDLETAQICVRAALTGHLVFSTLHTNDAPSTITRLMDIGIEPYLLAPSIVLIVAQRLVRKLCPECKEAYEPKPEQIKDLNFNPPDLIYRPKGCDKCNHIGYMGRIAIAEVMVVTEKIREQIKPGVSFVMLKNISREEGMVSLLESGLKKASDGLTSLEEVLGVAVGDF
ncbi:MAG: ATPase, T2SS/T4P/T4SS family [Candidatus Omnitrophota bacterium]